MSVSQESVHLSPCLFPPTCSPFCGLIGVVRRDGAFGGVGRAGLKVMRQRSDGHRSESCIANETLQRSDPQTLPSARPGPSCAQSPGSPAVSAAPCRHK